MESQKRLINIDLLRILACLFVVIAHASSGASCADLTSAQGITLHTFNAVGHTGTVLFFFMSGMFLLSEDYNFTFKKFYKNNFLRLLVAYIAWVIIYHAVGFLIRGIYTPAHIKDAITNIIYGNVYYHFWYLPMLLGIYLLLPFLRAICQAGKKLVFYFVILFLLMQVIFPTVFFYDFPYKYYLLSIVTRIPFTLINHHVGYFVLGYALSLLLKDNKIKKPRLLACILIIIGPIISLLGDYLLTLQQGYHEVTFNTVFSATLCMSVIGWFILFHEWNLSLAEKTANRITGISRLTFGIYILHPLVINYATEWIPYFQENETVLSAILMTLLAFSVSFVLTWLLSLIPFIRKWILFA